MTITTALSPASLLRRLRFERKMLAAKGRRFGRAWRYATGRMNDLHASDIITDCEHVAAYRILETLDTSSVLDDAITRWGDLPELEDLATDAVDCVAYEWTSLEVIREAAINMALDKIADLAEQRGITLKDLAA